MNPCWRNKISQIYASKFTLVRLEIDNTFQLVSFQAQLQTAYSAQYIMFTILNVLNGKKNFLDRRKTFYRLHSMLFLHNIFLYLLQSSRALGAHFRETFLCTRKKEEKYSNEIDTLWKCSPVCSPFVTNGQKVKINYVYSKKDVKKKRAKRDVGGHFYLQIFNVK